MSLGPLQDNVTNGSLPNESTINCTNCNEDELSPTAVKIFYTIYILAIILGAGGNITSIIVFTKGRRCNTDIRAFLINLALADLMMAVICIPFSFTSALTQKWVFSKPMCPVILFTQLLSVTVSVYTNTAISVDRFIAIKFPLKLLQTSRRHVLWVIAVIWIVSTCLCAVQFGVARAESTDKGIIVCTENWPKPKEGGVNLRQLYTVAVLVITYIIPVMVIMTMYSLVCIQLWFRTTPGVEDHARDAKQLNNKRKVVKMLMTMSALFTLCWMPTHLFFLINDYYAAAFKDWTQRDTTILYLSCNWLAMSNCFQNPIIYGFLNDNFRSDLAELVLKCCPKMSRVKTLQRTAMANQPLHRLSTKMTLLSERGDSRGELYKNGRRSLKKADSQSNGLPRKHNRRPLYNDSISSNHEKTLLENVDSIDTASSDSPDTNSDKIVNPRTRSVRIKSSTDTDEVEV